MGNPIDRMVWGEKMKRAEKGRQTCKLARDIPVAYDCPSSLKRINVLGGFRIYPARSEVKHIPNVSEFVLTLPRGSQYATTAYDPSGRSNHCFLQVHIDP